MNAYRIFENDDSSAGDPRRAIPERFTGQRLVVMVYRQMRSLAGPHPELEDLAQTALEQILSANFRGESKWSTFTHAVCYRVWMKHLRWHYRFSARIRLSDQGVLPEEIDAVTAASLVESRERYRRLHAALNRVSPKRRAVVILHDISGLEVEEIAHIVDAKVRTVRSRLRDGRKQLGQLLSADPFFGEEACEGAVS